MGKCSFVLCLTTTILWIFTADGSELRRSIICYRMNHRNSSCPRQNFLCFNGKCIERQKRCDGRYDCSDNSDEDYCGHYSSCPSRMTRCSGENKCILNEWFCDGITDCYDGSDEKDCDKTGAGTLVARVRAVKWVSQQNISQSGTDKWGYFVDKLGVLLYLGSANLTQETRKEIAYEVTIQLLSRLAGKKMKEISSSDLASYLNALLVTCTNPRKFHGMDIVQELRSRVDGQNYTNPYLLLSLCNAGDTITESDEQKLVDAFRAKRREFWTDVQAMAVMALGCAMRQPGNVIDTETLRELTLELKQLQYRNGTVENLQTTALVLQALLSVEPETDPDNFDDRKAMQQILAMQEEDGSFGTFQNTYYVLPVLNCRSLVNISSDHCEPSNRDEKSALEDLVQRPGPKVRVRYSLWIGDGRDLERHLVLKVPANMSFYGVMELAAEIDFRYRFEYVVKNAKPYVNAISGYQDDPERGTFWFLYPVVEGKRTLSKQSPADIQVEDNDHFAFWYRSET